MKRSKGIALGMALLTTAASAWFGCSSSNSPSNNSTSSSTGSGTGTGTGNSTSTSSGNGSSAGSSGTSTSSSTGSASGSSSSGTGTDAGDAGPSFATTVYFPWIQAHCVVCHHTAGDPDFAIDGGTFDASGGGVLVGNLDMATVDAAYANLVNVAAGGGPLPAFEDAGQVACDTIPDGSPGHLRVDPGAAAQSLLCLKLKGFLNDGSTPPPCGDPMPLPVPGFGEIPDGGQQAAFTAVQLWINGGALP